MSSTGWNPDYEDLTDVWRPSGAIAETVSRRGVAGANTTVLNTTKQYFNAIRLPSGIPITSANFLSGTTASSAQAHLIHGLYTTAAAPVLVRQSTDQLTVVWAANTVLTLALDSVPVTAGARVASSTVTLTFPTMNDTLANLFQVGDSIVVSNANIAAYNGTFTVASIPSATTLTYVSGGSATDSLAAPFPTVQLPTRTRKFTPTSAALYYLTTMVSGTVCSNLTVTSNAVMGGTGTGIPAPVLTGQDATTVVTGTLPSPAVALTVASNIMYGWVS